jgi:hypothetical protein
MPEAELGFYMSGGLNNSDPNLSLGGDVSLTPINDLINNLFDDVSGDSVVDGLTDYRCFYVVNDSENTYADVKLWIHSEYTGGSDIELGFNLQNEIQKLTLVNSPQTGHFKLKLDTYVTNPIDFDYDMTVLASRIQTAIRELPNGTDAVCAAYGGDAFLVEFPGQNKNHKYPLMELTDNNLTPTASASVTVSSMFSGSPVNLVAPSTGGATLAPTGVAFFAPTVGSKAVIGYVRPTEIFAVWIRRITAPETNPTALDGLSIKISGDLIL